jgi:hypothetical protein
VRQQPTIQASTFGLFAIPRIVVEDDPLPVGGEDGRITLVVGELAQVRPVDVHKMIWPNRSSNTILLPSGEKDGNLLGAAPNGQSKCSGSRGGANRQRS